MIIEILNDQIIIQFYIIEFKFKSNYIILLELNANYISIIIQLNV